MGQSVFGLCGSAIAVAVYRRDWTRAEQAFQSALEKARDMEVPYLPAAITGLMERFVLLPRDGKGVRVKGASTDMLWHLNRAEEFFCAWRFQEAEQLTSDLAANFPVSGWVSILQIRNLLMAGRIVDARQVLYRAQLGVIPGGDSLALEGVLDAAATRPWGDSHLAGVPGRGAQQFRMPLYFRGLIEILRRNREEGVSLLERAAATGEPAALMYRFDPLAGNRADGEQNPSDLRAKSRSHSA